jgi:hypothetical protein
MCFDLLQKTCPIHILTLLLTSPNTNLTYANTTFADCRFSNLLYQLQCTICNAFKLKKWIRCSQSIWMGTSPLVQSWTTTTIPHQIPPVLFPRVLVWAHSRSWNRIAQLVERQTRDLEVRFRLKFFSWNLILQFSQGTNYKFVST